jgi:hypothetical protein
MNDKTKLITNDFIGYPTTQPKKKFIHDQIQLVDRLRY